MYSVSDSEWRINGVGFADIANRILADPPRGQTEVWELENSSGGWSHRRPFPRERYHGTHDCHSAIHIHLIDFKVIYRQGDRNVFNYESNGLKDVVLLGRNEKVRVLAHYQPWDGVYMYVRSYFFIPLHSQITDLLYYQQVPLP